MTEYVNIGERIAFSVPIQKESKYGTIKEFQ